MIAMMSRLFRSFNTQERKALLSGITVRGYKLVFVNIRKVKPIGDGTRLEPGRGW